MQKTSPASTTLQEAITPQRRESALTMQQILIGLILLALIPILLSQTYFLFDRHQYRKGVELEANLEIARAVGRTFNVFVQDVLSQELSIGVGLTIRGDLTIDQMNQILKESDVSYPGIRNFAWISPEGQVVASSLPEVIGKDVTGRPYFREIGSGKDWVLSDLYPSTVSGDPIFSISRAVRDRNGILLGIVTAVVNISRMGELFDFERAKGGAINLVDSKGMLVYRYPEINPTWEERNWGSIYPKLYGDALSGKEAVDTVIATHEGKKRLVVATPIAGLGWAAGAGRGEEETLGPIESATIKSMGISLLIALASFSAALVLSRKISASIHTLREHALSFARGQYGSRVELWGPRELRDLALVFNGIAEDLVDRERESEEHLSRLEWELQARQVAEEALRESEKKSREQAIRLRAILDATPALIWTAHDRDCQIISGNRAASEFSRVPEGVNLSKTGPEAERLTHYRVFHEGKELALEEMPIQSVAATGTALYDYSMEFVFSDGSKRYLLGNVVPTLDGEGISQGAVAAFLDISERKQMEEELRKSRDELELRVKERTAELAKANQELKESEERLNLVLEGSQLGFWDWNIETGGVRRNERWAEMLGYTLEEIELTVEQWTDLHHPDDRNAAWKSIEDHLQGVTPVHEIEYRMLTKDGHYKWILDRAKVVKRDPEGKPLRMSGTHTDVTERRQMEEALRRSEEKFSKAFRHAPLMMALSRLEDGTYFDVNDRFVETSGFSREELIGKSSVDIGWISGDDRERLTKRLKANGHVHGMEITLHTKDGREVYCLYNGEMIETESHPLLLSIAQDITELKRAEEDLKAHALELERSNRELEDFSFITSHDLHEPLRKIQTFSDRISTVYRDVLDEQGRDWLQRIHRAAARMRALVEDVRRYSRLTTGAEPLSPVDLKEPIEDAVRDLRVLMEETGGQVEIGDLPTIEADPVQMRQLFQNLIGNALKFHGENTPQVSIHCSRYSEGVCEIRVEDKGIGFDEKYLERVFRPFQQLHKRDEYEGTGMGLAICRKIVERHGGSITAKSDPGKGATFIITLPIVQSSSEQELQPEGSSILGKLPEPTIASREAR